MSEPRTQSGPQPDESDARLDARLKDALDARHMPPGLAEKTMARIHAQVAVKTDAGTGSDADSNADLDAAAGAGAHAHATSPAAGQTSNPQAAAPQGANPHLTVVQPPTAKKRPRTNASGARRPIPRRRFVQLMAACIATGALAIGGGAVAFADETAQVEIEGSAVIELGLNRWGRVVRVWTSDDDLASALSALGLAGMSCEDALVAIAEDGAVAELLAHDRIELVACSDDAGQVQSVLDSCSAAADGFGPGTACSTADSQTRAEARAAGMGIARYQVYCEIAAIDPSYTTEACASMSMRELRDLLAELGGNPAKSGGHADQGFGDGNGQGAGGGNGQGMGRGAGAGRGQGAGMGPGAGGAHEE